MQVFRAVLRSGLIPVVLLLACLFILACGEKPLKPEEVAFINLPENIPARLWPVYVEANTFDSGSVDFWVRDLATKKMWLPSMGVVQNGLSVGWVIFPHSGSYEVMASINPKKYIKQKVNVVFEDNAEFASTSDEQATIAEEADQGLRQGFPLGSINNPWADTSSPSVSLNSNLNIDFISQPMSKFSYQYSTILHWWVEALSKLLALTPFDVGTGTCPSEFCQNIEDAEDTLTSGWGLWGSAGSITNTTDSPHPGRVISLNGTVGSGDSFVKRLDSNFDWNAKFSVIKWSQKLVDTYCWGPIIEVTTNVDDGSPNNYNRYMTYDNSAGDSGYEKNIYGTYCHQGLGPGAYSGTWTTITRELNKDILECEPITKPSITYQVHFIICGHFLIDDIYLYYPFGKTATWNP